MTLLVSIGTNPCKQGKYWYLDARISILRDTSRYLTGVDAFEIGEFEYVLAQDRWDIELLIGRTGTISDHPMLARNPIRGSLNRQQRYPRPKKRDEADGLDLARPEPKFKNACIAIHSRHFPYLKQERLPLRKVQVTAVSPGLIRFSIPEEYRRETAYEGGPVRCEPPRVICVAA